MTRDDCSRPAAPTRDAVLYPALLIAGIVVMVLSVIGIAAMSGLLPQG